MSKQVYNDDAFLVVLLMVQSFVLFVWGFIILSAIYVKMGEILSSKKIRLFFHIIGFSLLLFWTSGVYEMVMETAVDGSFDPYMIMGLEFGETDKKKIKKTYHKMQL
jgi:hypothetical protein